jgi:hypothetical protein
MRAASEASRLMCGVFAALIVAVTSAVVLTRATAQQAARAPDFSSNFAGWVAIEPDFIPVPETVPPVTFDRRYPYVSNAAARRQGISATFRVADLTHPNIKPWAKEVMKRDNDKVLAGGIAFTARSSCLPAGVPDFLMYPVAEPIYFAQAANKVTVIFAGDAQVRHVYLDVPHSPNPKPSWYGESVGHYEGDTLVVDTIGQNTKSYVDHYRTPHTDKLHVVERWRLKEPAVLEVTIRVDDVDTFNEPWTAAYRYRRIQRPMVYEEACAENNFATQFDYHIPVAARPDFLDAVAGVVAQVERSVTPGLRCLRSHRYPDYASLH